MGVPVLTPPVNPGDIATKGYVDTAIAGVASGVGLTQNIAVVTTAVTLGTTAATWYVAIVESGGSVTLPTAVGNASRYAVKNADIVNHSLETTSAQTIDGTAGPITIVPNQSLDLVSDGANWRIV